MKSSEIAVASDDGRLRFLLVPRGDGVHIVRHQCIAGRGNLTLVLCIKSPGELMRLLDEDALRFIYPVTFDRVRRAVAASLAE